LTYSAPRASRSSCIKSRGPQSASTSTYSKEVDDYATFLEKYQSKGKRPTREPIWHIHGGKPRKEAWPVSFALLLNLVSASNASSADILWGFIRAYAPMQTRRTIPRSDRLVGYAIRYYEDFVSRRRSTARRREKSAPQWTN